MNYLMFARLRTNCIWTALPFIRWCSIGIAKVCILIRSRFLELHLKAWSYNFAYRFSALLFKINIFISVLLDNEMDIWIVHMLSLPLAEQRCSILNSSCKISFCNLWMLECISRIWNLSCNLQALFLLFCFQIKKIQRKFELFFHFYIDLQSSITAEIKA